MEMIWVGMKYDGNHTSTAQGHGMSYDRVLVTKADFEKVEESYELDIHLVYH